jgi:L-aminopeptidase/D-esterase-like protein
MRYLHERRVGFAVGDIHVPIVPAACIFDLGVGEPSWPDAAMGYLACRNATVTAPAQGSVGAGSGATVGKLFGQAGATKSGIGTASIPVGAWTVGALVVVNAFGDVISPGHGKVIAGARDPSTGAFVDTAARILLEESQPAPELGNTTIGVVATDAALTPDQVSHLATVAHDGLARVIRPVHTMVDGDVIFALATGTIDAGPPRMLALEAAVVKAVERAVLRAVMYASP